MAPRFHQGNNSYLLDHLSQWEDYVLTVLFAIPLAIGFVLGSLSIQIIYSPVVWLFIIIFLGVFYWVMREYSKWQSGWKGEEKVRVYLMTVLPPSFAVFHDLKLKERGGNIDFVVVGPTGVFALEVKNNKGRVEQKEGQLMIDGKKFIGGDPMKQARGEASSLQGELKFLGIRWVDPIVVLSRQDTEKCHERSSCGDANTDIVCLPSLLDAILLGQGHLSDEVVGRIESHLAGKFCKKASIPGSISKSEEAGLSTG